MGGAKLISRYGDFMKKLLPLLVILLLLSACAPARTAELIPHNVYYAGDDGGVKTALSLAGYRLVTNPVLADLFVLNGEIPDDATITERVNDGAGLVLILDKGMTSEQASTLLGQDVTLTYTEAAISLVDTTGGSDMLSTEIVWNGAPQVRERVSVTGLSPEAWAVVSGYENDEGILYLVSGNVFVFTPSLSGEANPQMQEWGYFNYFIYHLVERAAGASPLSFADYPASPVPHAKDRTALFVFLGAELLLFFGVFILVRRWSLNHPEALDSLVVNRSRFEVQEEATDWEKVGFHRPLSGLLVGMGIGIILFIPLIIYQNLILPQFILPSAQALGMWGRVTQLFGLTWAIWDVGTSVASMKFLSQHRVSDPRRGFKYICRCMFGGRHFRARSRWRSWWRLRAQAWCEHRMLCSRGVLSSIR
jgi:hypothetical protein